MGIGCQDRDRMELEWIIEPLLYASSAVWNQHVRLGFNANHNSSNRSVVSMESFKLQGEIRDTKTENCFAQEILVTYSAALDLGRGPEEVAVIRQTYAGLGKPPGYCDAYYLRVGHRMYKGAAGVDPVYDQEEKKKRYSSPIRELFDNISINYQNDLAARAEYLFKRLKDNEYVTAQNWEGRWSENPLTKTYYAALRHSSGTDFDVEVSAACDHTLDLGIEEYQVSIHRSGFGLLGKVDVIYDGEAAEQVYDLIDMHQ